METPQWDKLFQEAYDLLDQTQYKTWADFIHSLDESHQNAILLGRLNGEVCNGGFQQLIDNGFYNPELAPMIKASLVKLNTESSQKTIALLEIVDSILKEDFEYNHRTKEYEYNNPYQIEDEDEFPNLGDEIDRKDVDGQYYKFNEVLEQDIESYLSRTK